MGGTWADVRYVAVDVEGNGQRPPDLVEVALVSVVAGVIGTPKSWLVRPPRPITALATAFHRLSDADVASAPPVAELAAELRAWLDGAVFVAHNASVDLGVLTRELPGFTAPHVVDTLKMARVALPGRRSYQLGALVADLGLAGDLPAALSPHRASWDALACALLFVRLAERLGTRSFVGGGDRERDVLF